MLDCIKRQLTYRIPLEIMSQTSAIQISIAKEAINLNGKCWITYETLHTPEETHSTMVVTLIVQETIPYERVKAGMMTVIKLALSIYSPSTETVTVTDIPVVSRDFNV